MTSHTDTSRPPIYTDEDGTVFYRASALGGCVNELVMFCRGEQSESKTTYIEQVMETGKEYEAEVRVHVAQQANYLIVSESDPIQLEVDPGHVIVGNTDGRMVPAVGDDIGAEFKTLGEDAFKKFVRSGLETFPEYQWQLSIYMHAMKSPWLYAAAPRLREKDDDGEWRFWVEVDQTKVLPLITEPPIPLSRIRRKIRRINTLAQMEFSDLPPCEKAKFCSMVRFHDLIGGNIEAEEAEKLSSDDELYDLLRRRQVLKDLEDDTAKDRKAVDAELKQMMEGPAQIEGIGRWVPVNKPGRVTLDRNQLTMDLGEGIEKYEKVGNPYREIRFYRAKG